MKPDANWSALGDAIVRRRVALGYQRQKDFAAELGISEKLLGELENARRTSYSRATRERLEGALFWEHGSVQAILDGGQPAERPLPVPEPDTLKEMGDAELVAYLMSAVTELASRLPSSGRRRELTGNPLVDYPGGLVIDEQPPNVEVRYSDQRDRREG